MALGNELFASSSMLSTQNTINITKYIQKHFNVFSASPNSHLAPYGIHFPIPENTILTTKYKSKTASIPL